MISRELKLKLTFKQETHLNTMLKQCTGLYNLIIRKIKLDAQDKIYHSRDDLFNLFAGHSKKTDLHSRTIQGTIERAHNSWDRCFKKTSGEPKLKGIHNKLRSIPFPDPLERKKITSKTIQIPIFGKLRYIKQEIPEGKIKQLSVIKRAQGWYLILVIDSNHTFPIKDTDKKVGIDTGFENLATLSDGTKIKNQRNYLKSQERLGEAQRGKNKKLVSRIHERIKNQRKDYNHKVSRKIIENYKEIYITNDNLKGQARKFGKSIGDAGISQLREFIIYKGENHGRKVELVESKNSTVTCNVCRSLKGPTGLSGLKERSWECSVCGTLHDRDINSAMYTLKLGLGLNLAPDLSLRSKSGLNRNSINRPKTLRIKNPTALAVGEVNRIFNE